MLATTREFQRLIQPGQPRLRLGVQVPLDAVNLAYVHAPALSPQENVRIVDLSGFVLENTESDHDALRYLWPDETRLLRDESGVSEVPSQSFLLTSVFAEGVPLFYAHQLRYPIYDPAGPDAAGFYRGAGVTLVDITGNPLPGHLKYRVALLPLELPNGNRLADHYWVYIYTSFPGSGIDNYRVQYSAVDVQFDAAADTVTKLPRTGYVDILNPQQAFTRNKDMAAVVMGAATEPHFYRANAPEFGHSRVYVPRSLQPDTRTPIPFDYTITADGVVVAQGSAAVLHPSSVLPKDFSPYENGSLVLVPNVRALASTATEDTVFMATSSNPKVRLMCRPDGRGPALATTREKTGTATAPDEYRLLDRSATERYFIPTYAVRLLDHRQIQALPPVETKPLENWYLRVQNGRFRQEQADGTILGYFLPEYNRQAFAPAYGMPYRPVDAERPLIIDDRRIRLRYTPLFVDVDDAMQPKAESLQILVNDMPIGIKSWNVGDGTIELAGTVRDTDQIAVRYHYEESAVTYRGYWNESLGRFFHLDLNPGPGHAVTAQDDDGELREVSAYRLLDKTIYIYLKPAAQLTSAGQIISGTAERDTLFHSFAPVNTGALLLAKILVRPNSNRESVAVKDTRVRGGGLKPEVTAAMMRELEPESKHYWDIGYWDGEPFMENAVTVIRLSRQILKEFGGRFSRQDVEEVVRKHIAFGVLPIIEFVDDDVIVQRPDNLVVDVVNVSTPIDSGLQKPRLRLTLEPYTL